MSRALRLFTPAFALVVLATVAALWVVVHRAGSAHPTKPATVVMVASGSTREPDEHVLILEDRCRDRRAERKAALDAAAQAAAAAKAPAAAPTAPTTPAPAPARATPAPTPTPAPAATPAASTTSSSIPEIIRSAFTPLGPNAVTWALRVSMCESGYNPRAVNASSNAEGLFQFLPSTWASTPYAGSSPFDPVANARAAEWLYARYGPGQWACK